MFERFWKAFLGRGRFSPLALAALVLYPVSLVYRLLVELKRRWLTRRVKASVPVISIGNITVGGSGKTPLVECLARTLHESGIRVGIVSSGYGRQEAVSFIERGEEVQKRAVAQTGDEVKLLAENLPSAVFSVNKVKAVAAVGLADSGLVDAILVDDGFQHFELEREMDIVTFDASVSARRLKMFPYGVLREPMTALKRAGIFVITRAGDIMELQGIKDKLSEIRSDTPQFSAGYSITELVSRTQRCSVTQLKDRSVFLFAGIGNFAYLQRQVERISGGPVRALELPDHEKYDAATRRKIRELVDEFAPDFLVTTAKDWVKVSDFDFGRELYYVPLTLELEPDITQLVSVITERLGLKGRMS